MFKIIHSCVYVCVCVCICLCVCVVYACMCGVCIYVCVCVCVLCIMVCVCMCICGGNVCLYVCICIYVYAYICHHPGICKALFHQTMTRVHVSLVRLMKSLFHVLGKKVEKDLRTYINQSVQNRGIVPQSRN